MALKAYPTQALSVQDINERVRLHMPLARKIAWQIHGRVRDLLDIDDLIQNMGENYKKRVDAIVGLTSLNDFFTNPALVLLFNKVSTVFDSANKCLFAVLVLVYFNSA